MRELRYLEDVLAQSREDFENCAIRRAAWPTSKGSLVWVHRWMTSPSSIGVVKVGDWLGDENEWTPDRLPSPWEPGEGDLGADDWMVVQPTLGLGEPLDAASA